jgi:shikimate dehydrogenase
MFLKEYSAMDRYAVFGNPISHSKSPMIHTFFARQTAQKLTYQAIEAPTDGFQPAVKAFFSQGGRGCNITVPFKEDAYQFAQQLSSRAKLAGAVNTLKLTDDGIVVGDNTDGFGLVSDLQQYLDLADKRVLLLGAGGAARGVIGPLLEQNVSQLVVANRTVVKAQNLAELFKEYGDIKACAFPDIDGYFDLIINSTSASLSGEVPAIDSALIHSKVICYDMMYGSEQTAFNQWAEQHGAERVIDGLGMLVGQAAESFAVWRGIRPSISQVLRELRQVLAC